MIPEDKQMKLELPCQFSYEDGVIERMQFHKEDDVWSMNMKRAVLNMVQVQLQYDHYNFLIDQNFILNLTKKAKKYFC